jgi:hypothetical protein
MGEWLWSVGYGLIRPGVRTDSMIGVTKFPFSSLLNGRTDRICFYGESQQIGLSGGCTSK